MMNDKVTLPYAGKYFLVEEGSVRAQERAL